MDGHIGLPPAHAQRAGQKMKSGAREECMHVLKSISAEVDFLGPIKSSTCGLPAPVRLKSLGSTSRIVFDPPVETNCRLMAALYWWSADTLQPEAKKTYKSTISRIVGASAYSCRNVYFLPTGNLSQHAFANAIDIGAFELADGRVVTILKGGDRQHGMQRYRPNCHPSPFNPSPSKPETKKRQKRLMRPLLPIHTSPKQAFQSNPLQHLERGHPSLAAQNQIAMQRQSSRPPQHYS